MKIPTPQHDENPPTWFRWLLPVTTAAMLGLTLVFTLPGFQSRYVADDYCFSAAVHRYDFWTAQSYFYQNVSNRFSVLPLINITEVFGQGAIAYVPFVAIILWLAASTWLTASIAEKANLQQPFWLGLLASSALVFFTILMAPNRFQSVYWRSGLLTYMMPLAFISLLAAILIRLTHSSLKKIKEVAGVAGVSLLAAFIAGFSETSTAVLVVALVFGIGIVICGNRERRVRWLPYLVGALVGSLIGLLFLFISPGNLRRTSVLPDPPGLVTLVRLSVVYAFDFMVDSLKTLPLPSLVGGTAAGLFGISIAPDATNRRTWLRLLILAAFTFGLLVAAAAPSVYAQSAYPEARAWFVGRWVLNLGLASLSFFLGRWVGASIKMLQFPMVKVSVFALAALLLLGYSARTGWQTIQSLPSAITRAQEWDARNQVLLSAPSGSTVSVQALDSWFGLEEMGPDPTLWVNHCAAEYYGLQAIQANE